ncbi:pyridoxamine 5'-phosphate oxidase family protein [Amycolatopsis sp.]|uniref:pyridoxamine 5'-phosphate oxidase family protein n=1 Tax=Amycolatopsis sp. TaxID=37632 RepID=UPI002D7E4661|nr:pyridoxamine 5'-phosphate oxidase family protein [Amycolatopsis sp.]HET6704618.1 pyridoxamine 5'-phosphate oxidase family protein [Amycolatopsis sp.]
MSVPDLAPLGPARCRALLASVPLGRLAFVRDGRPAIRPVNFTVAGDAIWLRSGRNSWADRLDGQPVTFEADAYDPGGHSGWSVIVTGTVRGVGLLGDGAVRGHHRFADTHRAVPGEAAAEEERAVHHLSGRCARSAP